MVNVPFMALVPGLLLPLIGALVYFVLCAGQASTPYICGAIKLSLLVLPFVVAWRWGRAGFRSPLTEQRTRMILEGLLAGIVMSAGLLWLMLGPGLGVMKAAAPQVVATARAFGATDLQGFLILATVMCILHALYEEYYWRWFIFGQLTRRMPLWLAHVVAAAAFSANHIVSGWVYAGPRVGIIVGLVVGFAGLCWTMLYRRHGSVLGVWVAHMICDAALFYVEWLMISGRI